MGGGAGWEIFYFKIISRDCLFCFLFFLKKKKGGEEKLFYCCRKVIEVVWCKTG